MVVRHPVPVLATLTAHKVLLLGAGVDPLLDLLETQWTVRNGLFVFHRGGKRIRDFRTAWQLACRRAGLHGRLVHDLRRTAARAYRRAGLAESDIMELCGWETREMFKRYAIKDEGHLAQVVSKRFNGTLTAHNRSARRQAEELS